MAGHFEACQKLDIALVTSDFAFPDAVSLVRRTKSGPAFAELALGVLFVFSAVLGAAWEAATRGFGFAVLGNVESWHAVGSPSSVERPKNEDVGSQSENEGARLSLLGAAVSCAIAR